MQLMMKWGADSMRMSSLLVGSIMGAAAVMVLARKRPAAIAAVNDAVCDTASAISHKSMEAFDAMKKMNWRSEGKKYVPKFSEREPNGSAIEKGIDKMEAAIDDASHMTERVKNKAVDAASQVTH